LTKKTTFSAFSNLIHCRPVHHCASFSQQYCEDVNNDENSEIAACDKNDWVISSLHRIDGVWARVFTFFDEKTVFK
jgi:hypothetical protein